MGEPGVVLAIILFVALVGAGVSVR